MRIRPTGAPPPPRPPNPNGVPLWATMFLIVYFTLAFMGFLMENGVITQNPMVRYFLNMAERAEYAVCSSAEDNQEFLTIRCKQVLGRVRTISE